MNDYPYVILSCAISLDGYLDDTSATRLLLSSQADFDRVDALRASCDAILIGANTIRKDNPQLLIRSTARQEERVKKGMAAHPVKVTITSTGELKSSSAFFTTGESEKIVYTIFSKEKIMKEKLASLATIVGGGSDRIDLTFVLKDLYKRGIKRLMVEGGSMILTQFLQEGLVNELQIAFAGFFVGQKDAPRFVQPASFPWNENNRFHLDSVKKLDDIAILIYKV